MAKIPYFDKSRKGWKGERYDETRSLSTTDIAKLVRQDIKEHLPDIKTSVRTQYFSGGSSLDVIIKEAPFDLLQPMTAKGCIYDGNWGFNVPVSPRAVTTISALQEIVDQYNYDYSDAMVDYKDIRFFTRIGVQG